MYILVARVPVPEPDVLRWGAWIEEASRTKTRHVKLEEVGPLTVSTVFLGLDHSFGSGGPPIVFETMIYEHGEGGEFLDEYQTRCSTWADAERMHEVAVAHATVLVAAARLIKIGGVSADKANDDGT